MRRACPALLMSWLCFSSLMAVESLCAADAQPAAAWSVGKPMVTYWAGPELTDAVARQMADGGFNVVWCREQDLDVAQRHGLRGMLTASDLLSPATVENPEKCKQLDALISRVAKHPAMYCYFITDEPGALTFPQWGKLVAHLRERDPAHMAYINLLPTYANNDQLGTKGDMITAYREHLRLFVEQVKPDLLSYDHYQFATTGDLADYFLNLAMVRDIAKESKKPFLNIVQACSWDPARRVPNGDEMRYLTYTTLAYGAQGLSYYVYCYPGHTGGIANADGSPAPLYGPLSVLNREFAAIAAQVQPLRSIGVYHLGMMPPGAVAFPAESPFRLDPAPAAMTYTPPERVRGAVIGLFGPSDDVGKATHAIVVNLDYKTPLETSVTASAALEKFDAAASAWSAPQGTKLPLQLPPGGGILLRLAL